VSTPLGEPLGVQAGEDLELNDEVGRPSLVAQAFEGWQLMAAAVAETDEALASVMSSGALLARAAFEEQIPTLLYNLAELLGNGGLASSVRNEVISELASRLWEPRFPFSAEWMLVQHQKAVADFNADQSETLGSGRSLWQMASTAIRRAFEPEPAEPPEKKSKGEWRINSTVERPNKIGQAGSLYCRTRQLGWRPRVRLEETTYQAITRTSASNKSVKSNQWVVLADERGRDFDRHEQPEFSLGLHNPPELAQALKQDETVSGAAYFLQLDVNKHRVGMAAQFVEQHKQAIRTTTQAAITAAAGFIPGGLLVPAGVLHMIPDLIIGAIQAILNRRIAATVLPSWIVQHTAIKVGGQPPRSAVLLRSEEQPNVTLVGAQAVGKKMKVVDDYGDFPVPQLWPRGRILTGPTKPNADADLPMIVPADLWAWVADHRRPLVWSDSWETGRPPTHGFRVLVPFLPSPSSRTRREPKRPRYVAALRVEVYYRRGWII
jgi:hypothetical protein